MTPAFPFPPKELPPPTFGRVFKPAHDQYTHFEHGISLQFDATSTSFSSLNAWWLADAALLAYWSPGDVEERCKRVGFSKVEPLDRKGTQGFVASTRNLRSSRFEARS